MNKVKVGIFWLVLFMSGVSFGQADVWYVGNDVKLDFSGGGDPVISRGVPVSNAGYYWESTTSISDPKTGQLIFAVVGDKLYDGGQQVAGTLGGAVYDVAQGTLVYPVPGSTNEYYLTHLGHSNNGSTPMSKYYKVTVSTLANGDLEAGVTGNITLGDAITDTITINGSIRNVNTSS